MVTEKLMAVLETVEGSLVGFTSGQCRCGYKYSGLYFVGGQGISILFFSIKGFAFSCSLGF